MHLGLIQVGFSVSISVSISFNVREPFHKRLAVHRTPSQYTISKAETKAVCFPPVSFSSIEIPLRSISNSSIQQRSKYRIEHQSNPPIKIFMLRFIFTLTYKRKTVSTSSQDLPNSLSFSYLSLHPHVSFPFPLPPHPHPHPRHDG